MDSTLKQPRPALWATLTSVLLYGLALLILVMGIGVSMSLSQVPHEAQAVLGSLRLMGLERILQGLVLEPLARSVQVASTIMLILSLLLSLVLALLGWLIAAHSRLARQVRLLEDRLGLKSTG